MVLLVVVILVGVLLVRRNVVTREVEPYYSEDPKTWVDDKGKGRIEVNVDKVTLGEGFITDNGEQYETADIETVFDYDGWYKGNYFKRAYYEGGKKVMSINPEMKPDDGIIEGFVLERFEDDIPYLYIFLDEDWKNEIPDTKVHWGYRFQNKVDYIFDNQISNGVYMVKIEDEMARFENNAPLRMGGVYVGDWREDNSTVIAFY